MYFTHRHKILIDQLQELCPIAFPKKPDPKVPLAVASQITEVQAILNIDYGTANELLRFWCQGKRYDLACSIEGTNRYNVYGRVKGKVNTKSALYHKAKLEEYYSRHAVGDAKYHKGSLVDYYTAKFPKENKIIPKSIKDMIMDMLRIPWFIRNKEVKESNVRWRM
jgi:sRNA-binding protein